MTLRKGSTSDTQRRSRLPRASPSGAGPRRLGATDSGAAKERSTRPMFLVSRYRGRVQASPPSCLRRAIGASSTVAHTIALDDKRRLRTPRTPFLVPYSGHVFRPAPIGGLGAEGWKVPIYRDGAAMESNHPSGGLLRPAGFEDRMGHQTPAAPRPSLNRRQSPTELLMLRLRRPRQAPVRPSGRTVIRRT